MMKNEQDELQELNETEMELYKGGLADFDSGQLFSNSFKAGQGK